MSDNQTGNGVDPSLFFEPESIAIVGSFREAGFGGYVVVQSLLKSGYAGAIYPVNRSYDERGHPRMILPHSCWAISTRVDKGRRQCKTTSRSQIIHLRA